MVTAIAKAPCLNEIRKAGGIVIFPLRDLLVTITLQNTKSFRLPRLLVRMVDRRQKFLEFDDPWEFLSVPAHTGSGEILTLLGGDEILLED